MTREPQGRRERNKEDKRERLRRAAWELFCEAGFDATTTRAIADRADVAAGTVFVYAKDKRDLLFLVYEERLRTTSQEALATLPKRRSLTGRLVYVFGHIIDMYLEQRELAFRFIKELPGASGPNADRLHGVTFWFFGELARLVEEEKARGAVRADVNAIAVAEAIFGLYFITLVGVLSGLPEFASAEPDVRARLRNSFDLLFYGIAPR